MHGMTKHARTLCHLGQLAHGLRRKNLRIYLRNLWLFTAFPGSRGLAQTDRGGSRERLSVPNPHLRSDTRPDKIRLRETGLNTLQQAFSSASEFYAPDIRLSMGKI
jgi:hypothetical protein